MHIYTENMYVDEALHQRAFFPFYPLKSVIYGEGQIFGINTLSIEGELEPIKIEITKKNFFFQSDMRR